MKSTVVFLALAMSSHAFAAAPSSVSTKIDEANLVAEFQTLNVDSLDGILGADELRAEGKVPESCAKLNPTDAQKQSYQDAVYESTKKRNLLQAQVKNARLDWMKNAISSSGTAAVSDTATKVSVTAMTELIQNKMELANTILFTILTPEQRQPAIECMKSLHKQKMHKRMANRCKSSRHGGGETVSEDESETID